MKYRVLLHWFLFLFLLLSLVGVNGLTGMAQEPSQWPNQDRIPGYDNLAKTPYLIADQNRTVHAFDSVWIEEQLVIVYSQWTVDQGWTEPIDILLPQLKSQARIKGVDLDQDGTVHLVFFSGDEQAANIYYSQAPLALAGRAPAWSDPIVIGEKPITPDEAALAIDSANRLIVLYSGVTQEDNVGLYATHSTDGGATWAEPTPVYLTYSDGLWPSALKMYVDGRDGVHAVWSVANATGNSEAVYHAKLESGETSWGEPVELAKAPTDEGSRGEVDTPSIIEFENELIIIYHDDWPTTRHMLRSFDDGRTWTAKVRLFPHVGSNGPASLVIDGKGELHMFFGNRVGQPIINGLWHSKWDGAGWSAPELIISREKRIDKSLAFDPSFANAVVSQGNVILVTWMTDPGAGEDSRGVWYSFVTLDTPELPLRPLPVPSATPTVIPTATATSPAPTPTTKPKASSVYQGYDAPTNASAASPAAPLVIAIIPVALLVLAVVVLYGLRYPFRG